VTLQLALRTSVCVYLVIRPVLLFSAVVDLFRGEAGTTAGIAGHVVSYLVLAIIAAITILHLYYNAGNTGRMAENIIAFLAELAVPFILLFCNGGWKCLAMVTLLKDCFGWYRSWSLLRRYLLIVTTLLKAAWLLGIFFNLFQLQITAMFFGLLASLASMAVGVYWQVCLSRHRHYKGLELSTEPRRAEQHEADSRNHLQVFDLNSELSKDSEPPQWANVVHPEYYNNKVEQHSDLVILEQGEYVFGE
jgi:hypothetical protein